MKKFCLRSAFLIVLLAPVASYGDVYEFRDKEGVIHFTNVPTHGGYRRVLRDSGGSGPALSLTNADYDPLIRSS